MRSLFWRLGLLWAVMAVAAVLTAGVGSAHPAPAASAFAASTSPSISASPQDPDADMPVWPFVVGTVTAVGVAAVWQLRRRP